MLAYLMLVFGSCLLGSFSTSYFLAKLQGVDLRSGGSGNLGASNATVLLGWKVGALVAVVDILKGVLPVLAARWLFPEQPSAAIAAGVCAVLGHIFPFYLGFRGGKGFATFIGMSMMLDFRAAAILLVLAIILTVVSNYIALATLFYVTSFSVVLFVRDPSWVRAVLLLPVVIVVFRKHWQNLVRIAHHEEIGLRSTVKGENRLKK